VIDADSGGLSGQSTGRGGGRRTGAIGRRLLLVNLVIVAPQHKRRDRVDQEDSVLIDEADPGSPLLNGGPCLAFSADLAKGRTAL
jgi:hypothetical protein